MTIDILPADTVVEPTSIMDVLDALLIEGVFGWTRSWGQTCCGKIIWRPVEGAGVGLDALAFMSWFQCGGCKKLYDRLWNGKGINVEGFILRQVGREALGCSAKEMKDVVIIELIAPR